MNVCKKSIKNLFILANLCSLRIFVYADTTFAMPGSDQSAALTTAANLVNTAYTIVTSWIALLAGACFVLWGFFGCATGRSFAGTIRIVFGVCCILLKLFLPEFAAIK